MSKRPLRYEQRSLQSLRRCRNRNFRRKTQLASELCAAGHEIVAARCWACLLSGTFAASELMPLAQALRMHGSQRARRWCDTALPSTLLAR